jgi:hypothetical protein
MNDFTKDELEIIHEDLCYKDMECFYLPKGHDELIKKIQSMIDNYCEHDEGFTQDSMMVSICNKCGAC